MTVAVGARNLFKVDAGVVHALLQARYYDGSKGEFLSEDPVFLGNPNDQDLTNPQVLDYYPYGSTRIPESGAGVGIIWIAGGRAPAVLRYWLGNEWSNFLLA
jgi:hypothetical protein